MDCLGIKRRRRRERWIERGWSFPQVFVVQMDFDSAIALLFGSLMRWSVGGIVSKKVKLTCLFQRGRFLLGHYYWEVKSLTKEDKNGVVGSCGEFSINGRF